MKVKRIISLQCMMDGWIDSDDSIIMHITFTLVPGIHGMVMKVKLIFLQFLCINIIKRLPQTISSIIFLMPILG